MRPDTSKMTAAQQLRSLAGHAAEAAKDGTLLDLSSKALSAGRARWYLRSCTHVGLFTRVYGRPHVHNMGRLIIGERVLLWSTLIPSEFAVFPGATLEIGDRTSINYGTSIAATGLVHLGRDCRLGTHVMIMDNDFHEIDNRSVMPKPRPVVLEDNVWLANRALILPGVTIGHDSVVGAGSVVMADVPPRSVVLGNPARVVKRF